MTESVRHRPGENSPKIYLCVSHKGLIFTIYELLQFKNKKTTQLKHEDLNTCYTEKSIANESTIKCLWSFVTWKMQTEAQWHTPTHTRKWLKLKWLTITNADATWKYLVFLKKLSIHSLLLFSKSTLVYLRKRNNVTSNKILCKNVHGSFLHNGRKLKTYGGKFVWLNTISYWHLQYHGWI